MADFCKQCSLAEFGRDEQDLARPNDPPVSPGYGYPALCEGCGFNLVDNDGTCIADCFERHGVPTGAGGGK